MFDPIITFETIFNLKSFNSYYYIILYVCMFLFIIAHYIILKYFLQKNYIKSMEWIKRKLIINIYTRKYIFS